MNWLSRPFPPWAFLAAWGLSVANLSHDEWTWHSLIAFVCLPFVSMGLLDALGLTGRDGVCGDLATTFGGDRHMCSLRYSHRGAHSDRNGDHPMHWTRLEDAR